ncbi:MAG: hypothetical protein L3J20_11450 [Flavobacteriaceae bacterium]|nr:hypothetical protein [Flavobacteriaceae bacterium]
MKNLELNQMEELKGGSNTHALVCGIGIGLLFTPLFYVGAAVAAIGCLVSDT